MKKYFTILFVLIAGVSAAQQTHDYAVVDPTKWIIPNSGGVSYALADYKGAKAFIIKKNFNSPKNAFIAYPKGLNFKNGEIELDMASTTGNDFIGLAFRIMDANHYESLYFRPASSNALGAVQYMPEKKAEFNWWDYEADKYQGKATLPPTDWFHVKAVVKGKTLMVYVDHQSKPVMVRNDLDPTITNGSVGFWFGNSAACAYKNLTVKTY